MCQLEFPLRAFALDASENQKICQAEPAR